MLLEMMPIQRKRKKTMGEKKMADNRGVMLISGGSIYFFAFSENCIFTSQTFVFFRKPL